MEEGRELQFGKEKQENVLHLYLRDSILRLFRKYANQAAIDF